MTPAERLRELAIRHAAFGWLDAQRAAGRETFTQVETNNLVLAGETTRLMPTQQGIWKPGHLGAALSMRPRRPRDHPDMDLPAAKLGGSPPPMGLALGDHVSMPTYKSWASSAASRKVMQANRSRDTTPELAVRRLLHAAGLRYRVDYRPESSLRRRADIVFPKQRVAIFIDGCYWHACPEHGTRARTNADYWSAKLKRNVARDADTTARLEGVGWTVLRFWEHEDPADVAANVTSTVRGLPN